ncbi:MAG: hypothetical protein ACOCXA_05105, partial [Planctomycetota bacterium]
VYLLLIAGALAWGGLGEALLIRLLPPAGDAIWPLALQLALLALYLLFVGRVLFGLISRACERQADITGAELTGSTTAMQGALVQVARLGGQPLDAPSWRHHSIATRIAFLDRIRRDPGLALWHHWYVSMLRLTLILLLVLALIISAVAGLQQPDLGSMMEDDPRLRSAVTEARQGSGQSLYELIAGAEEVERQRIALGILADLSQSTVAGLPDPQPLYRDRALLQPFLLLSTGRPALQLEIRNALAYALVAGTAEPAPADLVLAEELGKDLRAAFEQELDPQREASYRDTIGAIAMRHGRYDQAADQFARALKLIAGEDMEDQQALAAFQRLLERRLAAAEAGEPLPLEWTPEATTSEPRAPAQDARTAPDRQEQDGDG